MWTLWFFGASVWTQRLFLSGLRNTLFKVYILSPNLDIYTPGLSLTFQVRLSWHWRNCQHTVSGVVPFLIITTVLKTIIITKLGKEKPKPVKQVTFLYRHTCYCSVKSHLLLVTIILLWNRCKWICQPRNCWLLMCLMTRFKVEAEN